jgi:calcineurin-like phosphoesterase family protein
MPHINFLCGLKIHDLIGLNMGLFFTSDLHLGHVRALEIMPHRPWKTINEMDAGLINNYNTAVGNDDVCIFIGDVVMGKKFENVPKYLPQLGGIKVLIVGNHDFLPSELKPDKLKKMEDMYSKWFTSIHYGMIDLNSIIPAMPNGIQLCHFPILTITDHPDRYEKQYEELHPILKEGDWLLHGHTHSRKHLTAPNVIHVGVDAEAWNFKPVSFDKIITIINKEVYMLINGQDVPTDWVDYPKSFLIAAVPIYHEQGTFPKTWHKLAQLGITGLLKSNGCPVITELKPVKKDSTTVSYSYVIKANQNLDYFISISIFDKNKRFLKSDVSPNLTGQGELKSPNGEVGSIKLTVRPTGIDGVIDTKTVEFRQEQAPLF